MQCVIKRRAEFSANYRYYLPEWSEAENIRHFGPHAASRGHGHNYTLSVSVLGKVGWHGMVINLSNVGHIMKKVITQQLNYSVLNEVWPEFRETLPTTENIARVIWQRLAPYLSLSRIQLFAHPQLWADYLGNGMEAYLTVGAHFSAAHRLAIPHLSQEENTEIYGKCARPNGHGHTYHVEITVKGTIDPRTGMIVNLLTLEQVLHQYIIEPFDHTFLNKDIPYFAQVIPTAENIVVYMEELLRSPIANLGVQLHKIKLMESPQNSCELYCQDIPKIANLSEAKELALV